MRRTKSIHLLIVLLSCIAMAACGSSGNGTGPKPGTPVTGTLSLGLTDASTDQYRAVYVRIDEVQVLTGADEEDPDNWETVATPMEIYNLLALANGVVEELGTAPLYTGSYGKMRLIFGTVPTDGTNILGVRHPYANYAIDWNNRSHALRVPNDFAAGVIIAHEFDISEDKATELVFDFDASASVVQAGNSGIWLLKPTIRVLDMKNHATVGGIASDAVSREGIAGALISLQYETTGAEDEKDAVSVQTASVSDEENADQEIESGEFTLLVTPGSYRLVSYKDGYAADCAPIDAAAGETTVRDIELEASAMGAVEGNVSINGAGSQQYATLSFRQPATCGDAEATVEALSVNIVYNYFYSVRLPVGSYSLVASSSGMETVVYDGIEVTDGGVTYQNVALEAQF